MQATITLDDKTLVILALLALLAARYVMPPAVARHVGGALDTPQAFKPLSKAAAG